MQKYVTENNIEFVGCCTANSSSMDWECLVDVLLWTPVAIKPDCSSIPDRKPEIIQQEMKMQTGENAI